MPERPGTLDDRIAPAWHTILLALLIAAVASTGLVLRAGGSRIVSAAEGSVFRVYLAVVLSQIGLAIYVSHPSGVRALLGECWGTRARLATDVAVALLLSSCFLLLETAWNHAFGSAVATLARQISWPARVAWVGVAGVVAFSEELVYRGYLVRQFRAFTRSGTAAVLLQAGLFGFAHADRGLAVAIRIAAYGALFAVATAWRKSLLPAVLSHATIDIVSGLGAVPL